VRDSTPECDRLRWAPSTQTLCLNDPRLRLGSVISLQTGAKPESPLESKSHSARAMSRTRIWAALGERDANRRGREQRPTVPCAGVCVPMSGENGVAAAFRPAPYLLSLARLKPASTTLPRRELCKKVFQNEAKRSSGINKSVGKWDKTKPIFASRNRGSS
jgi:hypothetical protein